MLRVAQDKGSFFTHPEGVVLVGAGAGDVPAPVVEPPVVPVVVELVAFKHEESVPA